LRENLTTLERELGQAPPWEAMTTALTANFETVLGTLTPAELPQAVHDKVVELAQSHTTQEWLLKPGKRPRKGREVKIAEGVEVIQRTYKAPGGLVRATVEMQRGRIVSVGLSGDFFFYPADKLADLERSLAGATLAQVPGVLEAYYRQNGIESPGVTPQDLAVALGRG
jgi:hypothetical protein